ncbi:MAG: CHAT domain-containing protein [Planctomycetaceae bacterium]|nr:CHAT domain-containing protein [Planctomycetaceae bacterium]
MLRNFIFLVLFFLAGSVFAQQLSTLPGPEYDDAWERFSNGDFDDAMRNFNAILTRRTLGRNPWIDSICYYAMIGECQFQAGNYQHALEAYDQALNVYFDFPDWATYLNVNSNVSPVPRRQAPWGISNRMNPFGSFPGIYHIKVVANQNIVRLEGKVGIIKEDMLVPINAPEIFSCLANAIRHRAEILGPMSKFDRRNDELVEKLAGRPGLANHWSGTWVEVLYGLALAAAGKDEEAYWVLEKASVMPGQLEHPLTAIALCEMGRIQLRAEKRKEAADLFYEAGISAYHFNDPITLEESFRYSAICQRLVDRTKPCGFLVPALEHSAGVLNRRGKNACANIFVLVSLMEEAADEALTFGNPVAAQKYLKDAEGIMKTSALREGRYGGRWNYLKARAAYFSGRPGDLVEGNKYLTVAMGYMNKCSLWVSQIKHLAFLHSSGRVTTTGAFTTRKALELYEYLLREPTAEDWIVQPMDSLAVQNALPPTPAGEDIYELWFDTAVSLSYTEQAFEISERIRRKRFYSQIPLGNRLISLRAIFESPVSGLSRQNQLDRQELMLAFPDFAKLSQQAKTLRLRLQSLPSVPQTEEQSKQLASLYGNLEKVSVLQEVMLRSIALSRIKSPVVFPPFYTLKEIQDQLPEGTSLLVFFAARGRLYGFMINRSDYEMWPISAKIDALRPPISAYLTALGNTGPVREIAAKDLREDVKRTTNEEKKLEWKKRGNNLFKILLQTAKEPNFTELVVVPDNLIWYVPFESLCVTDTDGKLRPFIAANNGKWLLRYAPTASLGVPVNQGHGVDVETVVVAGKLFPKDDPQKALTKAADMSQNIANLTILSSPKVPGKDTLFATQLKRLVVLGDVPQSKAGPLAWNPFGSEAKLSSGIASWLELPWGGPRLIVLPGFHSSAETAIKTGNGSEIFFSVLAMQANGAHTILLTRWNQGGTVSYDLVSEFLRNYQTETAPKAWKEAVMTVANRSIHFDEEPRVKTVAGEEPLKANHPFFWSGFLLIDQGELAGEELPAEENEE